MNFISPINPSSNKGHIYILMAIDYFSMCVEEVPLKKCSLNKVIEFLEHNILSIFIMSSHLISDNRLNFESIEMIEFCKSFGIMINPSSNYYLQGNQLVESTNKNLIKILRRTK